MRDRVPFRRTILLVMMLLLGLLCAQSAGAEEKQQPGDIVYGEWSEWADQAIGAADGLEVQTRRAQSVQLTTQWQYRRYAYLDLEGATHYDAVAPDASQRQPDSGKWEELLSAQPLQQIGVRAGAVVYAGEWFDQQEITVKGDTQWVTQYRSRTMRTIEAALAQNALGMGVGEHFQLDAQYLNPQANRYWISSNQEVASVDKDGTITAHAVGTATISVLNETGVMAQCQVLVGERRAPLADGYYALRLDGSKDTLRLVVKDYVPSGLTLAQDTGNETSTKLRFQIKNTGGNAFRIRPIYSTIAYVGLLQDEEGHVEAGRPIKVHAMQNVLREKNAREEAERAAKKARREAEKQGIVIEEQQDDGAYEVAWDEQTDWEPWYWYAMRCDDGTYILYSQTDESIVLGASSTGEGAVLQGQTLDPENRLQRWALEKDASNLGKGIFWTMPVSTSGLCYISDQFVDNELDKHEGIDLSSGGRRINIKAVADGRVISVKDSCTHDYRKYKKDEDGKYIDPCSSSASYGKYVVVQHADGSRSMYAHLSKILVKKGQTVKQGETIAKMGTTGSSSGIHLHLECIVGKYKVDPRLYLEFPALGERLREETESTN